MKLLCLPMSKLFPLWLMGGSPNGFQIPAVFDSFLYLAGHIFLSCIYYVLDLESAISQGYCFLLMRNSI